jgi:selenophosphate synthetase-related protein
MMMTRIYIAFLVLANNSLLFPTTSLNIFGTDYAPVEDMNIAKEYDCCQAICDDLRYKAEKFRVDRVGGLRLPKVLKNKI